MILIGADFVPTSSNKDLFIKGDLDRLFGDELLLLMKKADYRIFNLETPLCDSVHPIKKNGANFSAPCACVKTYCAVHADLLTLANNHILDQGVHGLESTWSVLRDNGIDTVGTGADLSSASEPFLFSCFGRKIGVYACAEHEFSITEEGRAGANPYDPLETPDHVAELKAQCDYVIVLYHGGREYYRYPSPNLQKTCRKLVEKGADLVICQHSHCIGCEEKYRNGAIVYGQGNFLFDNSNREEWQTSLLIGIDENFHVGYYPLIKQNNGVRLAPENKAKEILDAFYQRSREITEEGFIKKQYAEFSLKMIDSYLMAVSGKHSLLFRILNKLSGYRLKRLILKRYTAEECICLQNYLECESIRELLAQGLRQKTRR